ncbi:MAG: hypothetical protein KKA81_08210 [Bacteroidetes bacterium]|nr:hypothetical protein [Bacteroidota bacterium]
MKKSISILILLIFIGLSTNQIFASSPPPPPPGHGSSGNVPGGGAPIGSGLAVLLGLGAAYGGFRFYKQWKRELDE